MRFMSKDEIRAKAEDVYDNFLDGRDNGLYTVDIEAFQDSGTFEIHCLSWEYGTPTCRAFDWYVHDNGGAKAWKTRRGAESWIKRHGFKVGRILKCVHGLPCSKKVEA